MPPVFAGISKSRCFCHLGSATWTFGPKRVLALGPNWGVVFHQRRLLWCFFLVPKYRGTQQTCWHKSCKLGKCCNQAAGDDLLRSWTCPARLVCQICGNRKPPCQGRTELPCAVPCVGWQYDSFQHGSLQKKNVPYTRAAVGFLAGVMAAAEKDGTHIIISSIIHGTGILILILLSFMIYLIYTSWTSSNFAWLIWN